MLEVGEKLPSALEAHRRNWVLLHGVSAVFKTSSALASTYKKAVGHECHLAPFVATQDGLASEIRLPRPERWLAALWSLKPAVSARSPFVATRPGSDVSKHWPRGEEEERMVPTQIFVSS